MPLSDAFFYPALIKRKEENRYRQLYKSNRKHGIYVKRAGKTYISFSCNDYLGLSHHYKVTFAAMKALWRHGAGSGASRLITGNHPEYASLENLLATLKHRPRALVFGSGYLANIGVISTLTNRHDLIIADKLCHHSMMAGAKLSQARLLRFSHNDMASCERLLTRHRHLYRNCLILTETIFGMDGDRSPINTLINLAKRYSAWLLTDDAHGYDLALQKRKSIFYEKHIELGTLSKAIGSYGGYVCAEPDVIDYLINFAGSFIYSTALPPATIASAYAALRLIHHKPQLAVTAWQRSALFTRLLGLPEAQSAIVSVIIGNERRTLFASDVLKKRGFLVHAIRPPTVAVGSSRLRFTFSARHTEKHIRKLVQAMNEEHIL